jgi:hypothetical protein
MGVSKNNPNARKAAIQKMYQGKAVKPVKYIGPHGIYITAQFESGEIILDNNKKPIPYKRLNTTV